jgi:hypothetical protein
VLHLDRFQPYSQTLFFRLYRHKYYSLLGHLYGAKSSVVNTASVV